jgi:hypothetical protein
VACFLLVISDSRFLQPREIKKKLDIRSEKVNCVSQDSSQCKHFSAQWIDYIQRFRLLRAQYKHKRSSHINSNCDNNDSINITNVKNNMSTQAQYLKQGDCLSRLK